jgi:hypothetical protein
MDARKILLERGHENLRVMNETGDIHSSVMWTNRLLSQEFYGYASPYST